MIFTELDEHLARAFLDHVYSLLFVFTSGLLTYTLH